MVFLIQIIIKYCNHFCQKISYILHMFIKISKHTICTVQIYTWNVHLQIKVVPQSLTQHSYVTHKVAFIRILRLKKEKVTYIEKTVHMCRLMLKPYCSKPFLLLGTCTDCRVCSALIQFSGGCRRASRQLWALRWLKR